MVPPEAAACAKAQHRYLGVRIECWRLEHAPAPETPHTNRPLARRQAQRSTEAPEDPVVPPDDVARGPQFEPDEDASDQSRRLG